MRWVTPWLMRSESRTSHLLRPTTWTCRCLSQADRPSTSVRRALTLASSRLERRPSPRSSTPGSVAFPHQLRELALEAGDPPFELIHPVAKRGDLALNELPRAVAHPLIDLRRGLLERLARESVVEHVSSSRLDRKATRPADTRNAGSIVAWTRKRMPIRPTI